MGCKITSIEVNSLLDDNKYFNDGFNKCPDFKFKEEDFNREDVDFDELEERCFTVDLNNTPMHPDNKKVIDLIRETQNKMIEEIMLFGEVVIKVKENDRRTNKDKQQTKDNT